MRPFVLDPLFASVSSISGVGTRTLALLTKVSGGEKLLDALFHMPSGVVDRRNTPKVAQANVGQIATLILNVGKHFPPSRAGQPWKVWCFDDTGTINLVFFRPHADWINSQLPQDAKVVVSGRVESFDGHLQITHPDAIGKPEDMDKIAVLEPTYPLTAGLSNRMVRKVILGALERLPQLPRWLDAPLQKQRGWPNWTNAIRCVHGMAQDASKARERLAYDEFLAHQLTLAIVRQRGRVKGAGRAIPSAPEAEGKVLAATGFALTNAQNRAISEIYGDMSSSNRMARLLHGDVGAGKTVVAALAIARSAGGGAQAALMAPTEILARQHAKTLEPWFDAAGISSVVLTGRDKPTERKKTLAMIADGSADVVIGTHAIFQSEVIYNDLAFAVVDEQHKFGVEQRLALSLKGKTGVDMLLMSATPIPRSLAMTVYGDMDISRLDEKPKGRKPIDTRLMHLDRLEELLCGLERRIKQGAQIYWVCPLVEESAVLDLTAAQDRFDDLSARFGTRVGLVHGRMDSCDKDAVMGKFSSGQIDILVSTTVIEVGVDVPQASVMVVENAQRFGMAQLHQLRGRVGRGSTQSYCVLLHDGRLSDAARKRLEVLRESNDGFYIAQEDLKLRGSGDILGLRQSGDAKFKIGDPVIQADLLKIAQDDARLILHNDPDLSGERGKAVRVLLYLFERDKALKYLSAG